MDASSGGSSSRGSERQFAALSARIRMLVRAIQEDDEAKIEEAIFRLSELHGKSFTVLRGWF
jgi:hypothetical protein